MANIRALRDSGVEDRQARAITDVVRAALTNKAADMADLPLIKIDMLWIKRLGGVIIALGVAATGFLYSEIGFVREEIGSVREELRTEIGSVREELRAEIGSVRKELRTEIGSLRSQIQANSAALARIEAALSERLTRN